METGNGKRYRNAVRLALLLGALGHVSLSAHATLSQDIWWRSSHNTFAAEVSRGAGVPHAGIEYLRTAPSPAGAGPNAKGFTFANNAGAWPDAHAGTRLPARTGGPVIDVKARVVPASAGQAVGNLVRGLGRNLAVPVGVALTVYNFASDLGFTLGADGDDVTVTKPLADFDGFEWQWVGAAARGWPFDASKATACNRMAELTEFPMHAIFYQGLWQCHRTDSAGPLYPLIQRTPTSPPPAQASSVSELADYIAAQSGWPTSSTINQVLSHAVNAGHSVQTAVPRVTGPASSPGESSTTTKPDGSVVTNNTTNNYTYNNNIVTVSTTTTTSTYNPSTGQTTTETTETQPEEPKDECKERPDSLACADLDTPDEEIDKRTETVDFEPVELFGGGSCPANYTAYVSGIGRNVTIWDWQQTCERVLPLRALVMALAAFAAALIVMPVRVQA